MRRWLADAVGVSLALSSAAAALTAQVRPPAGRSEAFGLGVAALLRTRQAPAPGREAGGVLRLALESAGWKRDEFGNYVLRRGSGSPRRVVACALDQAAFVVGEITDDGFLRLHDPADPRRHPLWAQFHEGQRVVITTARGGEVPGVIGVRSTHLWRRRPPLEAPSTVDELWLDVGARSRDEVERLGVRLLDAVHREFATVTFGADTTYAGANMTARLGCAAVATVAASAAAQSGETAYVMAAQSAFGYTGLNAVLARLGPVDSVVIVDAGLARDGSAPPPDEAVTVRELSPAEAPTNRGAARAVVAIGLRSAFPGTLVESVKSADEYALGRRLAALVAGPGASVPAPPAITVAGTLTDRSPADSLSAAAALLGRLADAYGVAGHEERVRELVRSELPAALRPGVMTDSAGNLILALGPDRDTTVFVAHLDEIGYEVKSIAPDGTVSLTPRGGFFPSLWEGQPALLHLTPQGPIRTNRPTGRCPVDVSAMMIQGIFVPRQTATKKQPDAQVAWFGTDSAGLVACGVRPGDAVTGVKHAQRLAGTRFTARSIDDRVGCTALLLALRWIDPAKLTHKVIFAWSVREEIGLEGAAALAAELRTRVRRVYAVDTFVSSDSPLESHRFAYAPIGKGAVVRALDNSSATPPAEVDRVVALARRAGIPIQVGTTNGGNDGAPFARYGAVDVPLSWPARYSHSPVETIDLADVDALAKLIAALAIAP